MVDLFIESGHASINKHDETLCGDSYSIKKNGEQLVAVLSDGLGSGVKANILSTLTANMLSTMMLNRLPIDECIETVASTLPCAAKESLRIQRSLSPALRIPPCALCSTIIRTRCC